MTAHGTPQGSWTHGAGTRLGRITWPAHAWFRAACLGFVLIDFSRYFVDQGDVSHPVSPRALKSARAH